VSYGSIRYNVETLASLVVKQGKKQVQKRKKTGCCFLSRLKREAPFCDEAHVCFNVITQ
jgi:hypothetical protein